MFCLVNIFRRVLVSVSVSSLMLVGAFVYFDVIQDPSAMAQAPTQAQAQTEAQTQSQSKAKTQTQAAPAPAAASAPSSSQGKGAYTDTPESVKQLLDDSKAAVQANRDKNLGVRFSENARFSVKGITSMVQASGDLMPPDKMLARVDFHTSKQVCKRCSSALSVNTIVLGNVLYMRPEGLPDDFPWISDTIKNEDMVDDVSRMDFLQYVTSWKNYGIENAGSTRVYHLTLTYDANALFEGLKNGVKSDVDAATLDQIDKLRSSVLVDDIWINADTLLVSQATSRIDNSDLLISGDDMFVFWNWGESIDISPPQNAVPLDSASGGSPAAA